MNIALEKPFQLFEPRECQQLIEQARELMPGRVMGADPLRTSRNNNVFWQELDENLKQRLWMLAERFRPRYPWTWFQEPVQISRYAPGEYYDWHSDTYGTEGRSSVRCLTLTCTLRPAPGAVFAFEDQEFDLATGQAVFFDSHRLHRAAAPISGERWALTVWYMQPNPALQPER
jgi:hypothetical protein